MAKTPVNFFKSNHQHLRLEIGSQCQYGCEKIFFSISKKIGSHDFQGDGYRFVIDTTACRYSDRKAGMITSVK